MFSRNKNKPTSTPTTAEKPDTSRPQNRKSVPPSLISEDLRIVGDLSSDGEIHIDGTIDGDIRTNTLLVGETAKIKGEIIAEVVRVHGSVNGQIRARNVNLANTARVTGDILHENLSIDTGAFLEGLCKRMETEKLIPKEEPKKDEAQQPVKTIIAAKPKV